MTWEFDPTKKPPISSPFKPIYPFIPPRIYRTKVFNFLDSNALLDFFKYAVTEELVTVNFLNNLFQMELNGRRWQFTFHEDREHIEEFYKRFFELQKEYSIGKLKNSVRTFADGVVDNDISAKVIVCTNALEEFTITLKNDKKNVNISIICIGNYFYFECVNEHWILNKFDFMRIK